MKKPIMLLREEFAQQLSQLINNSGLHPAIIQPMVETANNNLIAFLQQQYQKEKQEYEQAVEAEAEKVEETVE